MFGPGSSAADTSVHWAKCNRNGIGVAASLPSTIQITGRYKTQPYRRISDRSYRRRLAQPADVHNVLHYDTRQRGRQNAAFILRGGCLRPHGRISNCGQNVGHSSRKQESSGNRFQAIFTQKPGFSISTCWIPVGGCFVNLRQFGTQAEDAAESEPFLPDCPDRFPGLCRRQRGHYVDYYFTKAGRARWRRSRQKDCDLALTQLVFRAGR